MCFWEVPGKQERMENPWSDPLPEILVAVAGRLESAEDFTAFRGVCTAWRRAVTRDKFAGESRVLLLIPTKDDDGGINDPALCRISAIIRVREERLSKMTAIGVGFGWSVLVEKDGEVHLWKSKSGAAIHLPKLNRFPGYRAHFTIQRGALSGNPSDDPRNFELAVIVNGKLGFWKTAYPKWTWALDLSPPINYSIVSAENICYNKGTLYIVNRQGRILAWDPNRYETHICPMVEVDAARFIQNRTLYLAESSEGGLLLITRSVQGRIGQERNTTEFGVFSIDLMRREWNEVHGLGNDAVFVGNNASITVPAYAALPCDVIRPNCIYFTDDNFRSNGRGKDTGVCDMGDGSVQRFETSEDGSYPFPPPLWLDNAAYFKKWE